MARLDQGEATPARSCDVVELCRRELERMEARAPGLRWVLKVNQPAPGLVMLSSDATAEALANLLDNAGRHANSTVTVRISSTSEVLGISVRDDGSGLPDAARISAFERFVSLDGHGGSGLGLPIARGLAESQGGHLEYERGRFLMALPARRLEVDAAA
jgi:signal transduction histidine kinase